MSLVLDVWLDGFETPVGQLVRHETGALAFTYSREHLRRSSVRLSVSLPLREESFDDRITRAFFDNLLQEDGDALAAVMSREGLTRDDVAGLLAHLGKDCPGALSVLPQGAAPVKVPGDPANDYDVLTADKVGEIVSRLHARRRLPEGINDPSPLAGVQRKLAVTLLADGRFAQAKPGSGAPSTHILKVPDRDHSRDAVLEATAMRLSRQTGLATAEVAACEIGGLPYLLVKRFDRYTDADGKIARIHQEDFAQALGLPATLKYERRGKGNRKFDAAAIASLLDLTTSPVAARETFIRATLFDLLVGNVDAHAKNHALIHYADGSIDLAPRYDILPTRLDPELTEDFAFNIGRATLIDDLTAAEFDAYLTILGVKSAAARRRVRIGYAGATAQALAGSLADIASSGMKSFADLIAANMRVLLPSLHVEVPTSALERDAFVSRGGGWTSG